MGKYTKELEKAFGISGKVVVVTGGTGAIGGEICEGLALQGAVVCVLGTNQARSEAKAMELSGLTGCDLYGYGLDITDLEDTRRCFAQIREEHGPIWGLVCSAGLTYEEYLSKMDIERWQAVINANVRGTLICNKVAAEFMEQDGGGRIMNISSLSASHGKPKFTAYTPSKCAQDGMSWTLAAEWGRKNITVNSLWPVGAMFSRMNMYKNSPAFKKFAKVRKELGMQHFPREMSGVIAYLLSPGAGYINGQIIDCQGCCYRTENTNEWSSEDPDNLGHGFAERSM